MGTGTAAMLRILRMLLMWSLLYGASAVAGTPTAAIRPRERSSPTAPTAAAPAAITAQRRSSVLQVAEPPSVVVQVVAGGKKTCKQHTDGHTLHQLCTHVSTGTFHVGAINVMRLGGGDVVCTCATLVSLFPPTRLGGKHYLLVGHGSPRPPWIKGGPKGGQACVHGAILGGRNKIDPGMGGLWRKTPR